jgi:hypothetical protein
LHHVAGLIEELQGGGSGGGRTHDDAWPARTIHEGNCRYTIPSAPDPDAPLRLIPANLRASLAPCKVVGSGTRDWRLYKMTRDTLAARFALVLKDSAPGGKLMLWAHNSHLFYDDAKESTSVGEILHSMLGPRF